MSLPARDYQLRALTSVRDAVAAGKRRQLVVMPTGAGKTITFAHLLVERRGRGLVLAHRDELVTQAVDKIRIVAPELRVGVCKAERDELHADVIVASVQTLARPARLERLVRALSGGTLFDSPSTLSTLIVDEAHHYPAGEEGNTFGRVLEGLGAFADDGPLTVGFTATPDPLTSSDGLAGGWEQVVFQLGILDGIREGWLVDVKAKEVMLAGADFRALHSTRGEIKADEAEEMLLEANAPDHAARAYLEHARGMKAIAFTPTIVTAHAFASAFRSHGVPAEAVDGQMPLDERRAILRRLHTGETLVVPNAQVLTEGFDEPSVGAIIMARPTRSRPFAMQCIGRGLRPFPGKTHCVVLDLVGSVKRHDLMTVSAMFGVAEDVVAREGLLAASTAEARAPRSATPAEGKLVSRDIELFKGRAFAWVSAGGRFALSLGAEGNVLLEPTPASPDLWDVFHSKRVCLGGNRYVTQRKKLFAGLPMDYATGAAEDYMRKFQGAERLNDKGAAWRRGPASDKQKELLLRRRRWREGMTRGEASDALSALFAR